MNIEQWQHHHSFGESKKHIEKKTLVVVLITFSMMIAEIIFGLLTNSMALLADGIHMGTHAFALGISFFAYVLARKYTGSSKFVFGTWKIEILGAYSSALVLAMVAFMMIYSSIERIINPIAIQYNQALLVALIGLLVNLASAFILNTGKSQHTHHHEHEHNHPDYISHADYNQILVKERSFNHHTHHVNEDLNLKSAYMHVIADAMTSVFAIIALLAAKYFNLIILDPIMGIVGAVLITRWAFTLLKDSSKYLLDYSTNSSLTAKIKQVIESDTGTKISDLHVWKVADDSYSCIISLVSNGNCTIEEYKNKLLTLDELAHVTVEINSNKKINTHHNL